MIEVQHLNLAFGEGEKRNQVLYDVSFHVKPGEIYGLVGESGSGKTTVLKCLAGLFTHWQGELTIDAQPLGHEISRERCRQVQMVFQDPRSSLDPRMSVGRIISEPLRSLGVPGNHRERVHEVMEWVGLDPDMGNRFPAQFSGGQRQRIAIARALAPNPQLLVADEPVSALDVSVKAQLIKLLADLKERLGLTMLMVSHDIALVGQLCEETVVLRHGRVVESGETLGILNAPKSDYTRDLLAAIPVL